MVSAWMKAWLVKKDVTGDWRSEKEDRLGHVYILVETQVLILVVGCGEVGNVVCMDGICGNC